jgi:hypothetical protein
MFLVVSTFALQNLGKRPFKPILELFIDPLFTALTCGQVNLFSSSFSVLG